MKKFVLILAAPAAFILTGCTPQLAQRIEDTCAKHHGSIPIAGANNQANFKSAVAIPDSQDGYKNLHFKITCVDGYTEVRTAK